MVSTSKKSEAEKHNEALSDTAQRSASRNETARYDIAKFLEQNRTNINAAGYFLNAELGPTWYPPEGPTSAPLYAPPKTDEVLAEQTWGHQMAVNAYKSWAAQDLAQGIASGSRIAEMVHRPGQEERTHLALEFASLATGTNSRA